MCLRGEFYEKEILFTMKELMQLTSDFTFANIIAIIVLLFLSVKGVYEAINWVRGEIEKQYEKRDQYAKNYEQVDARIKALEDQNQLQFEKLNKLEESQSSIVQILDEMKEEVIKDKEQRSREIVAQARSSLYRLYGEFKKDFEEKGYITPSQYETFTDLAEVYEQNGGNHTFAEKIIPFVMSIPVHD